MHLSNANYWHSVESLGRCSLNVQLPVWPSLSRREFTANETTVYQAAAAAGSKTTWLKKMPQRCQQKCLTGDHKIRELLQELTPKIKTKNQTNSQNGKWLIWQTCESLCNRCQPRHASCTLQIEGERSTVPMMLWPHCCVCLNGV